MREVESITKRCFDLKRSFVCYKILKSGKDGASSKTFSPAPVKLLSYSTKIDEKESTECSIKQLAMREVYLANANEGLGASARGSRQSSWQWWWHKHTFALALSIYPLAFKT